MIRFLLLFGAMLPASLGASHRHYNHHSNFYTSSNAYLAQASQPVYHIVRQPAYERMHQQFAQMSYAPTYTRNYWTPARSSNFVNRNFAYMPATSDVSSTFQLTPVHRTYTSPQTVFPAAVQTQYLGNRMLTVPTLPAIVNKKTSKKVSTHSVNKSARPERIIVPVGTSVYRKVQYVDNITPDPAVTSIFDSWKKKFFSSDSPTVQKVTSKGQAKAATTKRPLNEFDSDWSKRDRAVTVAPITITELPRGNGTRVAAESEISEVKLTGSGSQTPTSTSSAPPTNLNVDTIESQPETRYIELEPSNQVPLTIQFPSRTTRLNIFGGEEFFSGNGGKDNSGGANPKGDLVSQPSSNGGRVLIGPDRKDEPLILKKDGKTDIPDRMQSIIKCIFPDFRFDGDDKIASAC